MTNMTILAFVTNNTLFLLHRTVAAKPPGIEFVALAKCDRDTLRRVCSSPLEQIKQPIVPSVAVCARCITTTARS